MDSEGVCIRCKTELGFVLIGNQCICDSSRGLILSPDGQSCICPPDFEMGPDGVCIPILECTVDDECADPKYCELSNNTCSDPCVKWPCGPNAYGTPTGHRCICKCIEGYIGNPITGCSKFCPANNAYFLYFLLQDLHQHSHQCLVHSQDQISRSTVWLRASLSGSTWSTTTSTA